MFLSLLLAFDKIHGHVFVLNSFEVEVKTKPPSSTRPPVAKKLHFLDVGQVGKLGTTSLSPRGANEVFESLVVSEERIHVLQVVVNEVLLRDSCFALRIHLADQCFKLDTDIPVVVVLTQIRVTH